MVHRQMEEFSRVCQMLRLKCLGNEGVRWFVWEWFSCGDSDKFGEGFYEEDPCIYVD
jgi:hypothetical protein